MNIVTLSNFIWSEFFLIPLLGITGLYLTIGLRGFTIFNLKNAFILIVEKNIPEKNSISPFQALMTAQAATVGTGNIIGVAAAIALGGPGAVFWMWIIAILGMSTKYCEAFLAIMYSEKNRRGAKVGGPMYYIKNGLGKSWHWLAYLFAFFGMVASFGIGNTVQANAIASTVFEVFTVEKNISGFIISIAVGLVILGGVKRIGFIASRLVPLMVIVYVLLCIFVILKNIDSIHEIFRLIFTEAFNFKSGSGAGMWLAIKWGFARGIFSNEAGLGSAAIAHGASNANDPVKQGSIAMIGTFIDTIIICTLTALVLLLAGLDFSLENGALISTAAFSYHFGHAGEIVLTIAIVVFAFTTILGWSYYGEKCTEFLFGENSIIMFRVLWVTAVFIGSTVQFNLIWSVADIFNGLMAAPNLIAIILLSPVVFNNSIKK
ncbi:MAG: sodium:alanine symporter family protein [Methylococcaceae bacterium TMED69]|nr:MAG: sodium:alanine symporter family protein [Methylococcaceae bacterium TMED69]